MSQRGPLRLAVGEKIVDGHIHQILACKHTVMAELDVDGDWVYGAKCCEQCLQEIRDGARQDDILTEEQILAAIREGDWDLSPLEERNWVIRAKRVWYYVRYGDEGVGIEQGAEGG